MPNTPTTRTEDGQFCATAGDASEPVMARLVDAEDPSGASDPPGLAEPIVAKLISSEPLVSGLNVSEPIVSPPIVSVPIVQGGLDASDAASSAVPPTDVNSRLGIFRRTFRFVLWSVRGSFCILSLVVLLAVLTAIPVLQLIAFGYLLQVAGGLAAGAKLRDSLPHLHSAGQIGLAGVAVFVAALPTQLLAHWESVAYLINPGSGQATAMRVLAIASSMIATVYLLWAWVRGGRLRHYLWPQPKRFYREGWRWSTWSSAPDRLWDFTASLELPKLFWLGARGAVGTLVWLIPAMIIVVAFRDANAGVAGLFGFICIVSLGIGLLYLPMLQAHFAAENRLSAFFEVRTIRRDFRRAPWAWLLAMICSLVILPIPLYLLKIEATPREVMWLPCLVFVAFILPARISAGLALRRARRQPEPAGLWDTFSRWMVRLLMLVVVSIYLLFVFVSQFTSWDGLQTWVQQHAILIPVPFLSGV